MRLVPHAADHYRKAVAGLRDAHEFLMAAEFAEARALVYDLIGGPVPVRTRKDGWEGAVSNARPCSSFQRNRVRRR